MKKGIELTFLGVIAMFYLWVGADIGFIYLDDGAAVFGAWNVLAGKIPYRDFMVIGGPAYFYLLAALFKITGSYLVVERIFNSLVFSGVSILVYVVSLELVYKKRWAVLAYVFSLACLGSYPHYSGAQPMAVFWSLASTAVFVRWSKNPQNSKMLMVCSILTAFSIFFRHDVGMSTAAAQTLMLIFAHRKYAAPYLGALAGGLFALGIFFLIKVPLGQLVAAFWEYPIQIYSHYAARSMPFSDGTPFDKAMFIMPFVIYPVGFILSFRKRGEDAHFAILYLCIFGALNLNQARLRPDSWHFLSTWVPCVILAAILAEWLWNRGIKVLNRTLLAAVFVGLLLFPIAIKLAILAEPGFALSRLEGAKGIRFLSESYGTDTQPAEFLNYEKAIQYINGRTKRGESIFVGSIRHDRICSADPLFYFLADRPSAVTDYEMHRGSFNTPEAQKKALSEIEAKGVRFIVLRESLDAQCTESNDSAKTIQPSLLDAYIQSHYRRAASFGSEHIYEVI